MVCVLSDLVQSRNPIKPIIGLPLSLLYSILEEALKNKTVILQALKKGSERRRIREKKSQTKKSIRE